MMMIIITIIIRGVYEKELRRFKLPRGDEYLPAYLFIKSSSPCNNFTESATIAIQITVDVISDTSNDTQSVIIVVIVENQFMIILIPDKLLSNRRFSCKVNRVGKFALLMRCQESSTNDDAACDIMITVDNGHVLLQNSHTAHVTIIHGIDRLPCPFEVPKVPHYTRLHV